MKETSSQRDHSSGQLRKVRRMTWGCNNWEGGQYQKSIAGFNRDPMSCLFLSCTQAETLHGSWAQQHPRGPGVGTLRASDRGADCRLPHPSRKGHWQDGPLQSGDRWASLTSWAPVNLLVKRREKKNVLPPSLCPRSLVSKGSAGGAGVEGGGR